MRAMRSTVAELGPNAIIVESPVLIAGGARISDGRQAIAAANEAIWRVDPRHPGAARGRDHRRPGDVYDVMAAGAQGTGSSSAIFTADDPQAVLEAMIRSVREAWDSTH